MGVLLAAGYWPDTYWPVGYWQPNYWGPEKSVGVVGGRGWGELIAPRWEAWLGPRPTPVRDEVLRQMARNLRQEIAIEDAKLAEDEELVQADVEDARRKMDARVGLAEARLREIEAGREELREARRNVRRMATKGILARAREAKKAKK